MGKGRDGTFRSPGVATGTLWLGRASLFETLAVRWLAACGISEANLRVRQVGLHEIEIRGKGPTGTWIQDADGLGSRK